jgi:hypothetical protein
MKALLLLTSRFLSTSQVAVLYTLHRHSVGDDAPASGPNVVRLSLESCRQVRFPFIVTFPDSQ